MHEACELMAVARNLIGWDFPTQDAYDKYLKLHPKANRSRHRVVENNKGPKNEEPQKEEPKKEEPKKEEPKKEEPKKEETSRGGSTVDLTRNERFVKILRETPADRRERIWKGLKNVPASIWDVLDGSENDFEEFEVTQLSYFGTSTYRLHSTRQVAPTSKEDVYRPCVLMRDGNYCWSKDAGMHAEAIVMWGREHGKSYRERDVSYVGGLGPDGRFYELPAADVDNESIQSVEKELDEKKKQKDEPHLRDAQELVIVARKIMAGDANMAYDAKLRDVRQKLRNLEKQLYRHEARQGGRPTDWRFVEDIVSVDMMLNETMRRLG